MSARWASVSASTCLLQGYNIRYTAGLLESGVQGAKRNCFFNRYSDVVTNSLWSRRTAVFAEENSARKAGKNSASQHTLIDYNCF